MSPMYEPVVSVIVPVYAAERSLQRCVESITGQTYANLEIILVDDASPDSCPELCDDFALRDSRVIAIHQPNGGPGIARNHGLKMASGDYIMFVDSDDYIARSMVEDLVGTALRSHADLVLCGYVTCGSLSTTTSWMPNQPTQYDGKSLLAAYLGGRFVPALWAKLYASRLLDSIELPPRRYAEDVYVMHEILGAVSKAIFIPKPHYHWIRVNEGLSTRGFDPTDLVDLEVASRILDYVDEHYPSLAFDATLHKAHTLAHILQQIRSRPGFRRYREVRADLRAQLQGLLVELDAVIPQDVRLPLESAALEDWRFRMRSAMQRVRQVMKKVLIPALGSLRVASAIPAIGEDAAIGLDSSKLRVVLIYRSPSRGGFSIENVFASVAPHLSARAEVTEYFLQSKWGGLRDLIHLLRLRADVFHITGDVHYLALFLPRRKVVLTVHDTYYLENAARGLKRLIYKLLWFDLPLRRSARITAISQVTRDSLTMVSGRRVARKVQIVPDPVHPLFVPRPRSPAHVRPRLLFVGTAVHKNLARTISAISGVDCEIAIIGELSVDAISQLTSLGIVYSNYVGLDMGQVYRQYCEADVVLFPSLREGFGLPILEAQAVGVPVVTSDIPPINEVAGQGACLVDPLDVASIRSGIMRVISDSEFRQGLVAAGSDNVKNYTASAVADQFLAVYEQLRQTGRS